MIKIVKELENNLVEIESDNGGFLDIGGSVAKSLKLSKNEIQYVEELTPEKAEERKKYYSDLMTSA